MYWVASSSKVPSPNNSFIQGGVSSAQKTFKNAELKPKRIKTILSSILTSTYLPMYTVTLTNIVLSAGGGGATYQPTTEVNSASD